MKKLSFSKVKVAQLVLEEKLESRKPVSDNFALLPQQRAVHVQSTYYLRKVTAFPSTVIIYSSE